MFLHEWSAFSCNPDTPAWWQREEGKSIPGLIALVGIARGWGTRNLLLGSSWSAGCGVVGLVPAGGIQRPGRLEQPANDRRRVDHEFAVEIVVILKEELRLP